jgi:hypothetical protein
MATGVGRLAKELDLEVLNREKTSNAGHHLARRVVKADVNSEEAIDVVKMAALGHRTAAADHLLGRLENNLERARER